MVAGDRVGDQFGNELVIGLGRFRQLLHDGRTGGGMIDPFLRASKPSLKFSRIFPEVVQ